MPPDHGEAGEFARLVALGQNGAGERKATAACTRLDIGQVNGVVRRKARCDGDVEQAVLAAVIDLWNAADLGLFTVLRDDEDLARLFRHQHPPIGQKGDGPRIFEGRNRPLDEGFHRIWLVQPRIDRCGDDRAT